MAVLAPAIPYIMAATAAVSTVAAVRQGQAAANAAQFNSDVALRNAAISDAQGQAAVEAQQRDAQRRIGSAVAAYGASGVQLSEGSPTDVLAESARMAALDAATLRYNYRLKGLGLQTQASLDSANASNSRTAAVLNGLGAGLKGASDTIKFGG